MDIVKDIFDIIATIVIICFFVRFWDTLGIIRKVSKKWLEEQERKDKGGLE